MAAAKANVDMPTARPRADNIRSSHVHLFL
jgi:hypothetical protein